MLKHVHLILALDCKFPPRNDEDAVAFLTWLINRIDMRVAKSPTLLKNPQGYYCGSPGNEGVTAVGILETSHTVIHSWDNVFPAKFQFDLYSCKDFDVEYVIGLCNGFDIIKGTYMLIDRDTELKVLEQGIIGEDGKIVSKQ